MPVDIQERPLCERPNIVGELARCGPCLAQPLGGGPFGWPRRRSGVARRENGADESTPANIRPNSWRIRTPTWLLERRKCSVFHFMLLRISAFNEQLIRCGIWYNEHRPHQCLRGRTSSEVHEDWFPARDGPRLNLARSTR